MWLEEFKDWVSCNFDIQNEDILQSPKEIDKMSIVIDFENEKELKRFTVWEDYSCVYESIIIDTEELRILERKEFKSDQELKNIFSQFYHA